MGYSKDSPSVLSDKKEFGMIDVFRVICAFGIVAVHVPPLAGINTVANYWIRNVLGRLGVPFFFITSGFFIQPKINNKSKIFAYVKHIAEMYLVYAVICLPRIVNKFFRTNKPFLSECLNFTKNFFFTGADTHLWYFVALIVAVAVLFFLVSTMKMSDKKIAVICILLYIAGVLGNAYIRPIKEIPTIGALLNKYLEIFLTTRNGLFLGLPYLFAGYFIRKNSEKIKNYHYGIPLIFFFILMNIETLVTHCKFGTWDQDMIFFLMPTAVCMFLAVSFTKFPGRLMSFTRHLRKLSVLIFGLHLLMNFYIIKLIEYFGMDKLSAPVSYITVLLITIIVSEIIIFISERKPFKWLKILY